MGISQNPQVTQYKLSNSNTPFAKRERKMDGRDNKKW